MMCDFNSPPSNQTDQSTSLKPTECHFAGFACTSLVNLEMLNGKNVLKKFVKLSLNANGGK